MGKRFLYFIIESAIPGGAEYELEVHFLIRSLLDVFVIYVGFLLNVRGSANHRGRLDDRILKQNTHVFTKDSGTMHTHRFRFISQSALVCVILPVFVGIRPVIQHIEAFLAPTSADSSNWATIPEMPSLPEPSVGDYSFVIGQTVFRSSNSGQQTMERHWDDKPASLMQWDEYEPKVVLSDRLSGTPTASQDPIENLASDGLDFNVLDTTKADTTPVGIEEHTPAACYDEEQGTQPRISFEQSTDGNDTTRTIAPQKVKEKSDAVRVSPPTKQAPIKVQTKIKCIETILKKAIIEPHLVNGQTEGLRITGLEGISLASELLLRSGDIIRAINGQPLTSKQRAYKIFKRARTQSTMRVDLLRDGETKALLFKLL